MSEAWVSTAEADEWEGYLLEILLEEKAFTPHPENELMLACAEDGKWHLRERVQSEHIVRKVTMNV